MRFNRLRGDISGGLAAAIISLPISVGYGLIVFLSLGVEFAPAAAMAGVYAAVFAGFFASVFGGSPIQITRPMISANLVLGTFVSDIASNPLIGASTMTIFILASLCVMTERCQYRCLCPMFFGIWPGK